MAAIVSRPIVLLGLDGHEGAIHLPAIETRYLDAAVDLNGVDLIVFTSKHAVFALDRLGGDWKSREICSIGSATSRVIASLGAKVAFEASRSDSDSFADEIAHRYKTSSVLYPRAREVAGNLEAIVREAGVSVHSVVLYETLCRTIAASDLPPRAALIFSAPSVAECFFAQSLWRDEFAAIAIGERTAKAIRRYAPCHVSPKPNIESAIEFAKVAF
ncbi:hypothetical protein AGMMS50229_09120 [Campylobacterota bacterium]|nr:hypothetical protein AGMMS50229_09120 [Campylobacterota bacterium]